MRTADVWRTGVRRTAQSGAAATSEFLRRHALDALASLGQLVRLGPQSVPQVGSLPHHLTWSTAGGEGAYFLLGLGKSCHLFHGLPPAASAASQDRMGQPAGLLPLAALQACQVSGAEGTVWPVAAAEAGARMTPDSVCATRLTAVHAMQGPVKH